MFAYHKRKVKFESEMYRIDRKQTASKNMFYSMKSMDIGELTLA